MHKSTVLLAALASILSMSRGAPGDRIIGGSPAQEGQFPYMVSLQVSGSHICGGSLLSKSTVLTGGHCLPYPATAYILVAGTNTVNSGGQRIKAVEYIIHPKYEQVGNVFIYDVAVMYSEKEFEFSSTVYPIQLERSYIDVGKDVILSGWGYLSYPGTVPNTLQYIKLLTSDLQECKAAINLVDPSIHICTYNKPGEGVCLGDSGSPLVRNGKQVGIPSMVIPCAIGYPDVYERVSVHTQWIDSVTK